VPAPLSDRIDYDEPLEVIPILRWWVRGGLLAIAVGLIAVFSIAIWLKPYDADGKPLAMGSHQQLGLPPCTFQWSTGLPCPSCGMTTSFALLMHGDVWNSLKANAVGTLLAICCLLLIPWCIASALLKRPVLIVSIERAMTWLVVGLLTLMLFRWVIVLVLIWWEKAQA
jgi:hypothetical protein